MGPPSFIVLTKKLIDAVMKRKEENGSSLQTNLEQNRQKQFMITRIIKRYNDSFRLSMYADDTCTVTTRGNGEEFMTPNQEIINTIASWTDEFGMLMNVLKLQRINYGTKNIDEDYYYKDSRITSVKKARLLGLNFTEQIGRGKRINLNNM